MFEAGAERRMSIFGCVQSYAFDAVVAVHKGRASADIRRWIGLLLAQRAWDSVWYDAGLRQWNCWGWRGMWLWQRSRYGPSDHFVIFIIIFIIIIVVIIIIIVLLSSLYHVSQKMSASILPRDAMHKRSLCRRPVSVRMSAVEEEEVYLCNTQSKYTANRHAHNMRNIKKLQSNTKRKQYHIKVSKSDFN